MEPAQQLVVYSMPGLVLLRPEGRGDIAMSLVVEQLITQSIEAEISSAQTEGLQLWLDCSCVSNVASTFLGMLLSSWQRWRDRGLYFCSANEHLRQLLQQMKLHTMLHFEPRAPVVGEETGVVVAVQELSPLPMAELVLKVHEELALIPGPNQVAFNVWLRSCRRKCAGSRA